MSKPVLESLFTFRGRRNRKSYFLYSLVAVALTFGLFLPIFVEAELGGEVGLGGALPLAVLFVPLAVSSIAVTTQRCRDFGWTGWAVLLCAIPYLGPIFSIALLLIPGTNGPNRYGPDPLGRAEAHPALAGTSA